MLYAKLQEHPPIFRCPVRLCRVFYLTSRAFSSPLGAHERASASRRAAVAVDATRAAALPLPMRLTLLSLLYLQHEASALVATTLAKPSRASSFAPPESSVVVGAGPAGLATAIMLSKRGWQNVQVIDRLPPPPSLDDEVWSDTARFYLIGIGGRGKPRLARTLGWRERRQVCCSHV